MGTEDNGLSLEGLVHRLEALERENAELRHKVATLESAGTHRSEIAALRSSDGRRDEEEAEPFESDALVSRRALLSKAGAAAVGAVAAGALLNMREAKAHHDVNMDDGISVEFVRTHALRAETIENVSAVAGKTGSGTWAAVEAENTGSGPGVRGTSETAAVEGIATGLSGTGVEGKTQGSNGTGVKGTGRYGVRGETPQAGFYGVWGRNLSTTLGGSGVRGENEAGDGVYGRGKNGGAGVKGESNAASRGAVEGSMENASGYGVWGNSSGIGVRGTSGNNPGVKGESSAADLGAVEGHNSGTGGIGVRGRGATGVKGVSNAASRGAVEGSMENASGYGVWGNSWGIGVRGSGNTHGVHGIGTNGYGGLFNGGKAQLRIVPKGSAGAPTTNSHAKGEVYMDSAGALFVCTVAGNPGTWRRVQTVAV